MNIYSVIHRYLRLKAMTPAERKKENPHVAIFAGRSPRPRLKKKTTSSSPLTLTLLAKTGKAAPGYYVAKVNR